TYCGTQGNHYWVAEGPCAGLAPAVVNGQTLPAPYDTLLPGATFGPGFGTIGMNASNTLTFLAPIQGGRTTGANNVALCIYDASGLRILLRTGDTLPSLGPGETIYDMGLGSTTVFPVVADTGAVVFQAMIDT